MSFSWMRHLRPCLMILRAAWIVLSRTSGPFRPVSFLSLGGDFDIFLSDSRLNDFWKTRAGLFIIHFRNRNTESFGLFSTDNCFLKSVCQLHYFYKICPCCSWCILKNWGERSSLWGTSETWFTNMSKLSLHMQFWLGLIHYPGHLFELKVISNSKLNWTKWERRSYNPGFVYFGHST